jgi:hypothetical protein
MYHVKTVVIILIMAMMLSAILTYASMMTIIQTAKDNTKLALDSYVTHNSIEIYDSLKNGSDFTEDLNKNIFKNEILSVFSLDISGNMVYSTGEQGEILYKMTIPNVDFEYENTLKLGAVYDVMIPITFAGKHLFDLKIPQKVTSYYNLK